jgi:hypothetical protein
MELLVINVKIRTGPCLLVRAVQPNAGIRVVQFSYHGFVSSVVTYVIPLIFCEYRDAPWYGHLSKGPNESLNLKKLAYFINKKV